MNQLSLCHPSPCTATLAYLRVRIYSLSVISVEFAIVWLKLSFESFLNKVLNISAIWVKYLTTLENGDNNTINLM